MTERRRIISIVCVLTFAIVGWLTSCKKVFAQKLSSAPSADRSDEDWYFRYDLLQMLLEERGLRVVDRIDAAFKFPQRSVIVITGEKPGLSSTDWGNLSLFVIDGGTLLVASDSDLKIPGIGRISNGPVTTTTRLDRYQGFEDCLRVVAQSNSLEGVSEIITNRSGWFTPSSGGWFTWETLVAIPRLCLPAASRDNALLAIGRWSKSESGLAIVSADASLFSNGMLWHGDNAVAAIRVSEMLCNPQKDQLVFFSDGKTLDSYRSRIDPSPSELPDNPPTPEPELKKALRLANAIVRDVANSNIVNETLKQQPRNVQPSRYFRGLMYLLAICFLFGTVWTLLSNGKLQAAFLAPRIMRSAYDLREHAHFHANDFRVSAGYLAREFCCEITGSRHTVDWQDFLTQILTKSSKLNKSERQDLSRIIDIACRGCHMRMTSHEFQLLGKSISILRAQHLSRGLTV